MKINIVVAGVTIGMMKLKMLFCIAFNHEQIITTGDYVKDVKSIKCWSKMSAPIRDKMKIAIGNHDAEFSKYINRLLHIMI